MWIRFIVFPLAVLAGLVVAAFLAVDRLSLAEISMLAGLPKAPSMNPVSNPTRAKQRQQYVLRRMTELGHIDATQYEDALKSPLRTRREITEYSVHAEY